MKYVLLLTMIDQEKEHFLIIDMNLADCILYIELFTLKSYKPVDVEPMNVFRVAVMKNACRVIAVHNHPSGRLAPSEPDKDITDRLIQVGRILNIEFVDHLIISPVSYTSFRYIGLMDELKKSLKYVPTYQVVEQIRKKEQKIAEEKLVIEKDKAKSVREKARIERDQRKKSEKEK